MQSSKFMSIVKTLIFGMVISSFLLAMGCGPKKANKEQIQLLNERKSQLKTMEQEIGALKKEKGQVEKQLAERKKKLEDAKTEKAKVIERLEKIEKGEYDDAAPAMKSDVE